MCIFLPGSQKVGSQRSSAFCAMPLSWVKAPAERRQKKNTKSRPAGSSKAKPKPPAKPKASRKRKAQPSASSPLAKDQSVVEVPKTMDPFFLEDFIQKAWQLGGYQPVERPGLAKLLLASGCTGSGSFASVCKRMLKVAGGKVKGVDQYGADWSSSAQQFLLRNHREGSCLFQDFGRGD